MVHVAVRHAFEQLRDDIIRINEDPSYVTLLMAVNTRTAKAELIPIPTIDNMTRIKDNLDQFPEAVQNAIKKNIPEADMKASTEIWEYLGKIKEVVDKNEKAIQEKPMREELGGAKNHDARNHA
jgi:gas vesicle protein